MSEKLNQFSVLLLGSGCERSDKKKPVENNNNNNACDACYCIHSTTVQFDEEMYLTSFFVFLSHLLEACVASAFNTAITPVCMR